MAVTDTFGSAFSGVAPPAFAASQAPSSWGRRLWQVLPPLPGGTRPSLARVVVGRAHAAPEAFAAGGSAFRFLGTLVWNQKGAIFLWWGCFFGRGGGQEEPMVGDDRMGLADGVFCRRT